MNITVLGSGTSSGVPVIGCTCKVCQSSNPKNNRLRSSCWIEVDDKSFIIDTGPDFRQQALTHKIKKVDGVFYTHVHADHIHGIDDLRVYNAYQKAPIPIYGNEPTLRHMERMFSYIFKPETIYPSLVPKLEPHIVSGQFECAGISVQMIPCNHGSNYQTMNYRIGNMAWLTDTNGIPDTSKNYLKNLDVLFIDALRIEPHPTHFHMSAALQTAKEIAAKKTYLIHLTHDYDHDEFSKTLPPGVELAFDGLLVKI